MILLKSNEELKRTFEKLILTLKVPVEWTGVFAVVGDYLILQGEVRSLFFNFENQAVATNLIEIPMMDEPVEILPGSRVQNILNLILYTFGKWGKIRGLKVEQTYARLNVMFASVMEEIKIRPELSEENFRFYQEGIRINYEDLIQLALEETQVQEEKENAEEEQGIGLWHNMIWQSRRQSIRKASVDFEETSSQRLGNNYYMVGFQCPSCASPLHMIIFPENNEVQIETDQGGVVLARAYTCASCYRFLTPWPQKLLADGEYFEFDFEADDRAYIDYLELLGKRGERTFNHRFNRFVHEQKMPDSREETAEESLEQSVEQEMNRALLFGTDRMQDLIEEGFYSEVAVRRMVEKKKAAAIRNEKAIKAAEAEAAAAETVKSDGVQEEQVNAGNISERTEGRTPLNETFTDQVSPEEQNRQTDMTGSRFLSTKADHSRPETGSERARRSKLTKPASLSFFRKKRKNNSNGKHTWRPGTKILKMKAQVSGISDEQKEYPQAYNNRFIENEEADQNYSRKEEYQQIERAEQSHPYEVQLQSEPEAPAMPHTGRNGAYGGVWRESDLKGVRPQQPILDTKKSMERISLLISSAPKRSRSDLQELSDRLRDPELDPDVSGPFLAKIMDRIRQIDQTEISKIAGSPSRMSFDEAVAAMQKLDEGIYLPELKENAMEQLRLRLVRIKKEECEKLADKFENQLRGSIRLSNRYHFNHMEETEDAEITDSVIRNALVTYAHDRGQFEYPILVLDTSRAENGSEGLVLTPDHLFYHNLFTTYQVRVGEISHVHASTGLLNKGIYLHRQNGEKLKIPYVADNKELKKWADELEKIIEYLQEKPESRNVPYLAQEKHQKIICLRCGHTYIGGDICPNCGYTGNQ